MTALPTLGPIVCRWIEATCVLGEGDYFGQPMRLRRWQKAFLYRAFELVPTEPELRFTDPASWVGLDMRRRYRRALLGLPKGNGKTPLAAAVGAASLAGPVVFDGWHNGRPLATVRTSPIIPIAAASYEQASLIYDDLATIFRESSVLSGFADVYEKEIILKGRPGRAYRVAAAQGTNDGQRPTDFLADELHEWVGGKERVHLILANGTAKRADSLNFNISTAGADIETLLGELYLLGQRVNAGDIEGLGSLADEFLFEWYEAPDVYDLDDPAQLRAAIRAANPAADDFVDVERLVGRFAEMPRYEFERYHLNRWTRAKDCWLPSGAWEANNRGPVVLDRDLPTVAAVDMALKHDSVAVELIQPGKSATDPIKVLSKVWNLDGGRMDVAAVENYLREAHRKYNLRSVPYDPAYFERSAQVLEDEGLPMLEFPQSAARMVPACQHAFTLITAARLHHDGDPILTDHVLSAQPRDTDSGWRLSKGKSKRKIDACIALVIGLWEATGPAAAAVAPPRVVNLADFLPKDT